MEPEGGDRSSPFTGAALSTHHIQYIAFRMRDIILDELEQNHVQKRAHRKIKFHMHIHYTWNIHHIVHIHRILARMPTPVLLAIWCVCVWLRWGDGYVDGSQCLCLSCLYVCRRVVVVLVVVVVWRSVVMCLETLLISNTASCASKATVNLPCESLNIHKH